MAPASLVPGEHLGTITFACPDCQYPEMELIAHPGWPRPLLKIQCHKCSHVFVVDKKKNDYFESLLEKGTNTQVLD
jgi:hypothetical protein